MHVANQRENGNTPQGRVRDQTSKSMRTRFAAGEAGQDEDVGLSELLLEKRGRIEEAAGV